MMRSPEVKELFTALTAMGNEMRIIGKNKEGRFSYADLAHIIHVTRPILTKHGLWVIQEFDHQDGKELLKTTVTHVSGQWTTSCIAIPALNSKENAGRSEIQALGGIITYLRRYSYCAALNIGVSDEDYDGEVFISKHEAEALKKEMSTNPEIGDMVLKYLANLRKNPDGLNYEEYEKIMTFINKKKQA